MARRALRVSAARMCGDESRTIIVVETCHVVNLICKYLLANQSFTVAVVIKNNKNKKQLHEQQAQQQANSGGNDEKCNHSQVQ